MKTPEPDKALPPDGIRGRRFRDELGPPSARKGKADTGWIFRISHVDSGGPVGNFDACPVATEAGVLPHQTITAFRHQVTLPPGTPTDHHRRYNSRMECI